MRETTMEHRRKELDALIAEIRDHPERDLTAQRERARVLSEVIMDEATATG